MHRSALWPIVRSVATAVNRELKCEDQRRTAVRDNILFVV